jgi:hypothetical protein
MRLKAALSAHSAGSILPNTEIVGSHQCPVRVINEVPCCLVPQLPLRSLRDTRDTLAWLALGTASVAVAAIAALLLRPPSVVEKPVYLEKPVIVEREKPVPVDRGCLAFCGNR